MWAEAGEYELRCPARGCGETRLLSRIEGTRSYICDVCSRVFPDPRLGGESPRDLPR
jgi:hypothetical protein